MDLVEFKTIDTFFKILKCIVLYTVRNIPPAIMLSKHRSISQLRNDCKHTEICVHTDKDGLPDQTSFCALF